MPANSWVVSTFWLFWILLLCMFLYLFSSPWRTWTWVYKYPLKSLHSLLLGIQVGLLNNMQLFIHGTAKSLFHSDYITWPSHQQSTGIIPNTHFESGFFWNSHPNGGEVVSHWDFELGIILDTFMPAHSLKASNFTIRRAKEWGFHPSALTVYCDVAYPTLQMALCFIKNKPDRVKDCKSSLSKGFVPAL